MSDTDSFRELLGRVRAGDELASAELVKNFEPAIRRGARIRLVDPRLGRHLDSQDICQSVLASFFTRATAGQFEVDSPEQLQRLLATMARNKLANQANGLRAARRDQRRTEGGDAAADVATRASSPSSQVAARELLDEARHRLTADERLLFDRRAEGAEWSDIAAELSATPDSLRKRLARAVQRIAHQLGME